jgi:hypothetical protein
LNQRKKTTTPCERNEELVRVERGLREAVKLAHNTRRAAQLADPAIACQRRRFAHQESCTLCVAEEREAA